MDLPEPCLQRPVLFIVTSLLVVIPSAAACPWLPVRELPDIDPAAIPVSMQHVGAAPAVVDAEVTTSVTVAVAEALDIDAVSSESELGGSRTVITFDAGRDIDRAASDVRAVVSRVAPDLPETAEEPEVGKNDAEGEPVLRLTFASERKSSSDLIDFAERKVVDRLGMVDGETDMRIYDERVPAMRVWLDRRAMAARDVPVDDFRGALRSSDVDLPAAEIEAGSHGFRSCTPTRVEDADAFASRTVAIAPTAGCRSATGAGTGSASRTTTRSFRRTAQRP